MGAMTAALLAQRTARCISSLDLWPSQEAQQNATAAAAAAAAPPPQPQASLLGPTLVNIPTIKIGKVLDQKLGEEITYLRKEEVVKMLARYVRVMDERPPPEKAATTEQLTALKHVLDTGRDPFVDFSVFGNHQVRNQKRSTLSGGVFDAKGVLRDVELYGPATVESWELSYDVLTTCLIMLDAVSRQNLSNYKKLILHYAAEFGPAVWHFLYQIDVRCRQELMGATHFELLEKHNTAIATNRPSSFDPLKPWDSVWEVVTEKDSWWRKEFERPAFMILTHTKTLASMIDGDVNIESAKASMATSSYGAPPPKHIADRPTKKPTKPKKQIFGPQKSNADGTMATSRFGKPLCEDYQDGNCSVTVGNSICAKDRNKSHQCAVCMLPGHGARHPRPCDRNQAQPRAPFKGKGGKGKGKGKGKKW
jgi:hypothetical protein